MRGGACGNRSGQRHLRDVTVLVHAHHADAAVHKAVRRWWDRCLALRVAVNSRR